MGRRASALHCISPSSPPTTLVPLAMAAKKGLLERLAQGPVIGDGGFVFALEKRGYVKAGPWTPESAVEDPEAVRQLHREFLRARARRAYWENMKPASGRPFCPAMSCPDNWGVTKGDAILVQQQEATRKEQIAEVQKIQMEKLKM